MTGKLQIGLVATFALIAAPAYANDSSTYQIQGEQGLDNTCHFTTTLTLPPGQKAVQENQVGFDAATCTVTMQRVKPDLTQEDKEGLTSKSVPLEAPLAPAARLDGAAPAAVLRRTRAFSRTFLVNRFNVFQHHVKEGVEYSYNGARISNAFCQRPNDQLQWRTAFWDLINSTTQTCRYNFNFTTVTASTGARYFSPRGFYCSVPTNILYNRHRTVGRANGTIVDSTSFGGSSGCLSQLLIKRQIIRQF